ncbi:RIPP2 protein, partial [Pterocles burchelli]|nr:RIPP2 protein [Pterocles burchelli]
RRRMEGGGMGCGCPHPPPVALPPQGYSPRSSSAPNPAVLPRRAASFWRPWVPAPGEVSCRTGLGSAAVSGAGGDLRGGWGCRASRLISALSPQPHGPRGLADASRKLAQYTHPVRLFWPKSRCYDYLYQEAEALLKNFPVQATISFYEDSDSEDDEDELEQ